MTGSVPSTERHSAPGSAAGPVGRMTVLASVQTSTDGSLSFGVVLTSIAGMALLYVCLAGWAVRLLRLEDRTRYDEPEDTYPAERIPAGRSWK